MLNSIFIGVFILLLIANLVIKKFNLLLIWTEKNGKPSWIRLASTVVLYCFVQYLQSNNIDYKVIITLGILIFFPKLLQKIVENWKEK